MTENLGRDNQQLAAFLCGVSWKMVPLIGIEPTTHALRIISWRFAGERNLSPSVA